MTSSTDCYKIRTGIIQRVPVNVMDIRFSNISANTTDITSVFRNRFLKVPMSVLKAREINPLIESVTAFFGTIYSSSKFNCRFSRAKFLVTPFTSSVWSRFSKFFRAFYRTESTRRVFKTGFQNLKRFFTCNTISINSFFKSGYIRAFPRTKALLLVPHSAFLNAKFLRTYSTNKILSFFLKVILANSGTKNSLLRFNFIRKGLKYFTTIVARNIHGRENSIRKNYKQGIGKLPMRYRGFYLDQQPNMEV